MKRMLIWCSIIINVVLLSYIFITGCSVVSQRNSDRDVKKTCSNNNLIKSTQRRRVAILQPASHPSLDEIRRGFVETINAANDTLCEFKIYNANGNRLLMRAQIEEIIQKKYDLIYSIGAHATQMVKEITSKKNVLIPIVFGAVAYPVQLKLTDNDVFSGNHLTGSSASTNYPKQIDLLLAVRPDVKSVLIVYDPTQSSGLEKDKLIVERLLKQRNIRVKAVEVYKTNEIFEKITSLLSKYDVAFVFKDNTVVPAVDSLVKLCTRYGTTLFVTDLGSVDKGAALGFGVHEFSFGLNAAKCALDILLDGKKPSEVPIRLTDDYKLRVNTKTMHKQNVFLDERILRLMRFIEIA